MKLFSLKNFVVKIRKMKNQLLAMVGLCWAGISFGQNQISGQTSNLKNVPLSETVIGVKGLPKSCKSNSAGEFIIEGLKPKTYVLKANYKDSLFGEIEVDLSRGSISDINFQLSPKIQEINEVFIVLNQNAPVASTSLRIDGLLLDQAQNIQVVEGEVLAQQQVYSLLEGIERNVSGAQRIEHWDNYARINMRGAQITPFQNGMNMKLSSWSPLPTDMSMVDRVEFVKGPAGFMLGAGEPAGFYNVVTKTPTGKTNNNSLLLATGSNNLYRAAMDLDGALSKDKKVLYRFNTMIQHTGSHRDFEYNEGYLLAPVLTYALHSNSKITGEYIYQHKAISAIGSNYAFSKNGYADLPVNFTTAEANLDPTTIDNHQARLLFEHQLHGRWKFTAQGSYLKEMQIGQSLWPWGIDSSNDSLMQRGISIWDTDGENTNFQAFVNGKINTGFIQHKIVSGVDASNRNYWAAWNQGAALGDLFNIYDPQYGSVSSADLPQWDRSLSVRERGVNYQVGNQSFYLQDELSTFKGKVRLTVAGRYTALQTGNPYAGSYDASAFTPRLGLLYKPMTNLSVYALYDESFLANPGFDYQGNNFDPLTGENLEFGIKKNFFNNKLNVAMSAYRITRNNVLTTDTEHPDPLTGQFIYQTQTGQQQSQGLELDIRGQLHQNLYITMNYAYLDARITKDADPTRIGASLPGASEHIQNTFLRYQFSDGLFKGLSANIGYSFLGNRSSWFAFESGAENLPNYFRMDAGIGYTAGPIGLQVTVNNLLNDYLYSGAPYGDMYYWQTEAMRNFRLQLSYKF